MIDLSSRDVQSLCKKLQRTSLVTNVLMCVITAVAVGVTVWASTTAKWVPADWAEITFFVLLGIIALYFVAVFIWEMKLKKAYNEIMCSFIAQGFYANEEMLRGNGEIALEIFLAGDKLTVMRQGFENYVQFDLSPVKSYTSVCANAVRRAKQFMRAYYFVKADRPASVTLTDKIHVREKTCTLVSGGLPAQQVRFNYFIKHGIIN